MATIRRGDFREQTRLEIEESSGRVSPVIFEAISAEYLHREQPVRSLPFDVESPG
jgi:hypothetical protein